MPVTPLTSVRGRCLPNRPDHRQRPERRRRRATPLHACTQAPPAPLPRFA